MIKLKICMQLNQQQYEIFTGMSSFYDPLIKTGHFVEYMPRESQFHAIYCKK